MSQLAWNWLCLPYLVCAAALAAVGLVAALVRGDRVLRLGTIGASTTALPWALCSAVASCTDDAAVATRLFRLGNGPVALVGPSLLLVLLGASGQLERHRWIARIAGVVGLVSLALCWSTDYIVSGVHLIPAGVYYIDPGPLTGVHFLQIGLWLAVGMIIVRRSTSGGERRRVVRMLLGVLALGTIGATDLLLVYQLAGIYPLAWLCATIAAVVALYYEIKTDLLRPQGFDRNVFIEALGFAIALVVMGVIVVAADGGTPVALATVGSLVWVSALGIVWATKSERPVRIARERALEEFVASLADVDIEGKIAVRLASLWGQIHIEVRRTWRVDPIPGGVELGEIASDQKRPLDFDVATWLVDHGEPLASVDLGTMRLGAIRPKLEALVAAHRATLVVPLIDRGTLVGLVDADHREALREEERGLVGESARAAGRALTYLTLARTAARERETAREVELAEAMRLQAAASRDDELGRWAVAAEYRTAPRTTGAGWSTSLLHDGRLALLVTEAQAHGVASALATAALTGAFAAATTGSAPIALDDLLASLRASAEGVVRGGEPVAAFVAILDGDAGSIAWACAGHPGAAIVSPPIEDPSFPLGSVTGHTVPVALLGGGGGSLGASLTTATRGTHKLAADALLVIASSALRGNDDAVWSARLREHVTAGSRMAAILVDAAARASAPTEDLLAVVVRRRLERRSEQLIASALGHRP